MIGLYFRVVHWMRTTAHLVRKIKGLLLNHTVYDRTTQLWNSHGDLLQLTYAKKACKKGATGVGLLLDQKKILLAAVHYFDKLIRLPRRIKYIDKGLYLLPAGLVTDGNYLTSQARTIAEKNRVVYGNRIGSKTLAQKLADLMAQHVLAGELRVLGAELLVADYEPLENKVALYFIDNSGIFFTIRAFAIGFGASQINTYLKKHYRMGLSIDEGKQLVIQAIKRTLRHANPISGEKIDFLVVPQRMP